MKTYNVLGYAIVLAYTVACFYFAPPSLGPWAGVLIGEAYFVTCWFVCGVYLSLVLHMGITHGALSYNESFVKGLTIVNNVFGVYVNPVTWVNRHRLHHTFSDHPGDPNKLHSDGFWKTMYLCVLPYESVANVARDPILKTWPFRLVANPVFPVVAQLVNFSLLWWLAHDLTFAAVIWVGTRVFALWINMIQNFWTHDRRFGYRRYHDDDNAMNIGEWLPVTATFSACLQNNHHHTPGFLRLSHDDSEYDFGFRTVKIMKALGFVQATRRGLEVPKDIPLKSLNF